MQHGLHRQFAHALPLSTNIHVHAEWTYKGMQHVVHATCTYKQFRIITSQRNDVDIVYCILFPVFPSWMFDFIVECTNRAQRIFCFIPKFINIRCAVAGYNVQYWKLPYSPVPLQRGSPEECAGCFLLRCGCREFHRHRVQRMFNMHIRSALLMFNFLCFLLLTKYF